MRDIQKSKYTPRLKLVKPIEVRDKERIDRLEAKIAELDKALVASKIGTHSLGILAISIKLNKMIAQHNINITKLRREIESCKIDTINRIKHNGH